MANLEKNSQIVRVARVTRSLNRREWYAFFVIRQGIKRECFFFVLFFFFSLSFFSRVGIGRHSCVRGTVCLAGVHFKFGSKSKTKQRQNRCYHGVFTRCYIWILGIVKDDTFFLPLRNSRPKFLFNLTT